MQIFGGSNGRKKLFLIKNGIKFRDNGQSKAQDTISGNEKRWAADGIRLEHKESYSLSEGASTGHITLRVIAEH